jgi:ribosome-binding factor A
MNQRAERLGSEIQAVLAEIVARGEIRDSRVRGAGIVTITRVRVTGDLSEARASFTVFGADAATLEQVRRGLQAASPYLQQVLGRRLRARKTALLKFEVDRSLDNAFRIDGLLRGAAARDAAAESSRTPLPVDQAADAARLDDADQNDDQGDHGDGDGDGGAGADRDGSLK